MPLRRNDNVVGGLSVPYFLTGGEVHMSFEDLQRRLSGAVMLGELMSGQQRHHGLPQFVGVPAMQCVRSPPAVCLPCLGQLFVGQLDQRNRFPRYVLRSGLPQLDSRRIPAAAKATTLIASRPM